MNINWHKLTLFKSSFNCHFYWASELRTENFSVIFIFFREITVFVFILATIVYPHAFSRILSQAQKLRFEKLEKRCKHEKSKLSLIRESCLRCRSYCALHLVCCTQTISSYHDLTNQSNQLVRITSYLYSNTQVITIWRTNWLLYYPIMEWRQAENPKFISFSWATIIRECMRSYIPTEVFHLRHLEEDEEKALAYFKFGAIVSSESKCQPLTFTRRPYSLF